MNRNFLKTLICAAAFLLSLKAFSQNKTFTFDSEMCTYTGIYNPKKYSEERLVNTFKFLCNSNYISASVTVWKPEEMYDLNQNDLTSECNRRLKELKENKFVETDFWKQAKQNRIHEIEETCKLKAITIAAYKNPDTLKNYDKIDSLNGYYRDALIAGGDKMLEAWKVLNEVKKKKNGYPERVQERFDMEYNSPERLEYARMDIMSFGWWNNSNHTLYRSEESINYFKEFEKLFISLKSDCENEHTH